MLVHERQKRRDCWVGCGLPGCSSHITEVVSPWLKGGLDFEVAFKAGCESFLEAGFYFGDPEEYLHAPGHPHTYRPDYACCDGCNPPVHGECIMLCCMGSRVLTITASELTAEKRASRRTSNSLQRSTLQRSSSCGSCQRNPREAPPRLGSSLLGSVVGVIRMRLSGDASGNTSANKGPPTTTAPAGAASLPLVVPWAGMRRRRAGSSLASTPLSVVARKLNPRSGTQATQQAPCPLPMAAESNSCE